MSENNDPPGDQDLIKALKAGDNRAFKQVYRQAYALVAALITNNGGSDEDAQDVFQETLFVLVKNCRQPDFKLMSALNTYLYAVARNIWRTRLRGKKHSVEFKDTIHDFKTPPNRKLASSSYSKKHELIRRLLEQLSDQCKQILMSYYYEKKSMRDIGEAMGLVENGVRVQKHRCMSYLKNKVEEHPDFRHLKNDEV